MTGLFSRFQNIGPVKVTQEEDCLFRSPKAVSLYRVGASRASCNNSLAKVSETLAALRSLFSNCHRVAEVDPGSRINELLDVR